MSLSLSPKLLLPSSLMQEQVHLQSALWRDWEIEDGGFAQSLLILQGRQGLYTAIHAHIALQIPSSWEGVPFAEHYG